MGLRCASQSGTAREKRRGGLRFAATLRSDARDEKVSRVKQIVEWLGADFDGVIIFDESHAMQNAAGGKGEPMMCSAFLRVYLAVPASPATLTLSA